MGLLWNRLIKTL